MTDKPSTPRHERSSGKRLRDAKETADDVSTPVFPADAYVSFACYGDCKVCGKHQDLRMGACFKCSDQVDGREIPGGHELWDSKNPSNRWKVTADQ